MTTKRGSVQRVLHVGGKFIQVELDSGERVEVPVVLWDRVTSAYGPEECLVFVERRGRLFQFVQWVGTDQEAWRAVQNGELRKDEYSHPYGLPDPWGETAARKVAAAEAAQRELAKQPWREEAIAGCRAAAAKGVSLFGLFSEANPYWCLSFESLVRWNLTSADLLEAAAARVAEGRVPEKWDNPLMLRDLVPVYGWAEALVRIGIWQWATGLEPFPTTDEIRRAGRKHAQDETPTPVRNECLADDSDQMLVRARTGLERWKSESLLLRPLLEACEVARVEGNVVTLAYPANKSFLADKARQRSQALSLEVSKMLATPVRVEIVMRGGDLDEELLAGRGPEGAAARRSE